MLNAAINKTELKICLLGDTSVGKSSIVQRFVHNTFNRSNETIGASFMNKSLFIKGANYKLNIWDTAGQETFKALMPMYYRGANICIVVYDVCCANSFQAVQWWIKELQTYLNEQYLICIAGNKCDLVKRRVITTKEAKDYAESVGAYFIETSARSATNINELFINAINLYRENTSTAEPRRDSVGQRIVLRRTSTGGDRSKCC